MQIRYIVGSRIGQGGFGEVLRVTREADGQEFAMKRLTSADEQALKRFGREVRILSSLNHANIVSVVGRRLEGQDPFYIMPLYKTSLASELGAIVADEGRIRRVFSRILDGIEYAHSEGVIHRDLKPQNVLMNSDDDVVISDFGLGRRFDASTTRATLAGYGLGTPLYMAPEQVAEAKAADERADIYSLGRMLFELYTGPLSVGVQDTSQLSFGIRTIVERCTKANPAHRYQSIGELKLAWQTIQQVRGTQADLEEFAALRVSTGLKSDQAKRLLELFARFANTGDELHDFMMETAPATIQMMHSESPGVIETLISRFCDFTADKSWGFGYTDRIAKWCEEVFDRISESGVRANLIRCVFVVGVDHNRFFVIDRFYDMLQRTRDADSVIAVSTLFERLGKPYLPRLISSAQMAKVPPELRRFFRSS